MNKICSQKTKMIFLIKRTVFGAWTSSFPCCCSFWMLQVDIWSWSHTCWGSSSCSEVPVCKWVRIYISGCFTSWPQITLDFVTFDFMNIQISWDKNPHILQVGFQLDFIFSNHIILTISACNLTANDLWTWYVTSDPMNTWRFLYCIH